MNKCLDKAWVQYALFIIISVVYFLGVSKYFDISLEELKALEPNALGDFLAGTFSCLGFILLILGFLQNTKALKIQGDELKKSTQALDLQLTELQNSVQQQKDLVQATEAQQGLLSIQHEQNQKNYLKSLNEQNIQSKLNALPVIQFKYYGNSTGYEVINIGAPVISVYLIKKQNVNAITPYIAVLKTAGLQQEQRIIIDAHNKSAFSFEISFTTKQGLKFKQTFENKPLQHNSNIFEILPISEPEEIEIIDY